ncbi:MAG: hypothetical protein D3903_07645 [Candidatus Electrothrix sp. GM3_4]|nr:hypothetical protein [Candidatus Electrothrix sp. GM3_4]
MQYARHEGHEVKIKMEFYFYPENEEDFKKLATGHFVRTLVFNTQTKQIEKEFVRSVNKHWEQTCKNNIETDHRIKELIGECYQIFSWVTMTKTDFNLPGFKKI